MGNVKRAWDYWEEGNDIEYACPFIPLIQMHGIIATKVSWFTMVHGKAVKYIEKAAESFYCIDLRYLLPGEKGI